MGFALILGPIITVYAASSAAPIIRTNQPKTNFTSPSEVNILNINSAEQNSALGINCGFSTISGSLPGLIKGVEKITTGTNYEETINSVYCENNTTALNSQGGGILGILSSINNTIIEQRPASGVQFAEDTIYAISNQGKVLAQDNPPASYFPGTGFDLLSPIRGFWGWSVNVVFGFLVVIILLIAFAIIFRAQLPGNITVSVSNSIPNIVIAMILVPLSYAITGLFIDGITVGSNIVHDFLLGPQSPGRDVYNNAVEESIDNNRGLYIDDYRVSVLRAKDNVDVRQEVASLANNIGVDNNIIFGAIAGILNIFTEENNVNQSVSDFPGAASAWIGTLLNFFLSIFMIYISIRIFVNLFKKYLSLLLMPIFSPFIFATVAVPGNGTKAIINFAKNMGASTLGFIVTYALLLLTVIFSNEAFQQTIPDFRSGLWVPPLLGIDTSAFNDIGGGSGIVPFLMALISIGIFFSIPKILEQIDQALGAQLAIPEFIRTPIDSFRDSYNRTKGFAFKTVPTLASRGINVVRNTPESLRRAGTYISSGGIGRSIQKINPISPQKRRIAREAKAGYTQDTPGGELNRIKRDLDDQWANLNREYQTALDNNDVNRATALKRQMNELDSQAASVPTPDGKGIRLSHSLKPEERNQFNVSFQAFDPYNSSNPNEIVFTPSTIFSLMNRVQSNPTEFADPVGKLNFKITGPDGVKFSNPVSIECSVASTTGGPRISSDEYFFDPSTSVTITHNSKPRIFSGFELLSDNVTMIKNSSIDQDVVEFAFQNPDELPGARGVEYSVNVVAIYKGWIEYNPNPSGINISSLVGERIPSNASQSEAKWKNGQITDNVKTFDRLIFRIVNKDGTTIDSNPIKLQTRIAYTYR